MLRHRGKSRTINHNKKIATLFSFVGGSVNVAGFLSVQRLTTNITGHYTLFIDEVFKFKFLESIVYFLFILFFFLGSFVSNIMVELTARKSERSIYIIPITIEIIILLVTALFGQYIISYNSNILVFCLLFAMGLQNSLVTRISDAVVRTTHLTGLFTDMGIELSQLLLAEKTQEQKNKLLSTINLRMRIIIYFFIGGVVSGILYSFVGLNVLLIPTVLLIIGLIYDNLKFRILSWKRKNS